MPTSSPATVHNSVATAAPQVVPDTMPKLRVSSYGLSDRGQARSSNEDGFVIADFARTLSVQHTNIPQPKSSDSFHRVHVFLVADGVGGSSAGEVASTLSVKTIEDLLLNTFRRLTTLEPGEEQSVLNDLRAALFQTDHRIFHEAHRHPEWRGMGTTLTMALAVNQRLLVAHAGDSRCYLFSHGVLQQLTHDHTVTAELADKGLITPNETATHPWRHVVTNLLGGSEPGVRVELHSLELRAGDVVLLCSDGLTEMVPEDEIASALGAAADPQTACEALVGEANRRGGRDNITAIVARFESADAG